MSPDMINAMFELFGGFFIINNCFTLYRDKYVKGVSVVSTAFFSTWGIWNLYFYPTLGQWLSFVGGLLIVLGNLVWVGMMIYYTRNPGGKTSTLPTRAYAEVMN